MADRVNAILFAQKGHNTGKEVYEVLGEHTDSPSLPTIDVVHKKIHDGKRFVAVDSGSILSGAKYVYSLAVGDHEVHFVYNVSADGKITAKLSEAPTITVAGTAITPVNRNRSSLETSHVVVKEGVTATDNGILLDLVYAGSAAPKSSGEISNRDEFILKANTTYLLELTAGANIDFAATLDWYEE